MRFLTFSLTLFLISGVCSGSNKFTCRFYTSELKPGLVSETAPSNTIMLSFEDGMYKESTWDLVNKIDPETNIILIVISDFREKDLLNKFKAKKNVRIIEQEHYGSIWTRDWVPQQVIRKDGSSELVNLSYDLGGGYDYLGGRKFSENMGLPYYESWLSGEMGNIMSDGRGNLFVTEKILKDNIDKEEGIGKKRIIDELKRAFEASKVHILPVHPRDGGVGHIDLIAKYVGKIDGQETVLVSDSIRPEVKTSLDQTAEIFKKLGYRVLRIEEYEKNIRSGVAGFVNSLIFNNKVYLPRYSIMFKEAIEIQRLTNLEKKARAVYESLGFEVIEVDGSAIQGGGAIHCLTCSGNFKFN